VTGAGGAPDDRLAEHAADRAPDPRLAEARHWRDLAAAHPVKPAMAAETASPAPVDLLSATNGRP